MQRVTVISRLVYLVESGANVSAEDSEALREAAANGSLSTVVYLVDSGSEISSRETTRHFVELQLKVIEMSSNI